ncbi:CHAD domain-containing protein [Aerococcus agrisoli]|uniref:CHAD domain-containing protein n=1 Tax=Aerococcus agrisoli TaxID=2487350 RepID=A0A3N4G9W8_9LACT|nr:CHAD domain-containing protein [Aerococcus agrisoli]RPA59569.1 CHAD domain-containing protein [Aerococcus agrisoli]
MTKRQQIFALQIQKIADLYQHYQNNPFSPTIVHDLRVAIRSLRALVHFVKKRMSVEEYDQINQSLGQAAQVLGPLRELDVLDAYCSQYAVDHPTISDAYYQLFNTFAKDRRIEMNRTFNKTNQAKIADAIELSKQLLTMDLFANKKDWRKYTEARMQASDDKLAKAVETTDMNDYQGVHSIRKQAKKLKYAAHFFNPTVKKNLAKYEQHAGEIQSDFGKITDNHVNYQLLTDYAEKVSEPELQTLLLTIRDEIPMDI